MSYAATTLRLLTACIIIAAAPIAAPAATVDVPSTDPAMKAAYRKAAASLDAFLAKLRNPPSGAAAFGVKVGFVATSSPPGYQVIAPGAAHTGYSEYFWLGQVSQTAQGFEGVIDNESEHVAALSKGQRVAFKRAEIADWMYMQDGKIVGWATGCPSLAHASDEQRRAISERFGLNCD